MLKFITKIDVRLIELYNSACKPIQERGFTLPKLIAYTNVINIIILMFILYDIYYDRDVHIAFVVIFFIFTFALIAFNISVIKEVGKDVHIPIEKVYSKYAVRASKHILLRWSSRVNLVIMGMVLLPSMVIVNGSITLDQLYVGMMYLSLISIDYVDTVYPVKPKEKKQSEFKEIMAT